MGGRTDIVNISRLYPEPHWPGAPKFAQKAVARAIESVHRKPQFWTVPLEVIGWGESNWSLRRPHLPHRRGYMNLDLSMYRSARKYHPDVVPKIHVKDAQQATIIAICYIMSWLPDYQGYHGLAKFLGRSDRGPGNLLRAWVDDPSADPESLRPLYRGF